MNQSWANNIHVPICVPGHSTPGAKYLDLPSNFYIQQFSQLPWREEYVDTVERCEGRAPLFSPIIILQEVRNRTMRRGVGAGGEAAVLSDGAGM